MFSRFLLATGLTLFVLAAPATARTWTSGQGGFRVEAELVELRADGTVVLSSSDGQRLQVRLDQLSAADQDFVRRNPVGPKTDVSPPDKPAAPSGDSQPRADNGPAHRGGQSARLQRGKWIECLSGFEVAGAAVAGDWARQPDGAIRVAPSICARLSLPVVMPQDKEYDLRTTFVRLEGREAITIMFPVGGRHAHFQMDGWGSSITGLKVDREINVDPRSRHGRFIQNNVRTTVEISVRVQRDTATINIALNGREAFRYVVPVQAIQPMPTWELPNGLGLGSWQNHSVFYSCQIKLPK